MLSSSTLSNSSTSPIFYVDDNSSYLIDDATNYSPYSLIYNEIDNFGGFFTNHELSIIQQSVLDDDDNIENNNIYSSIDAIDNCSKMDSKKSGDHESESINGIVEDNGEANHLISSYTTTTTTTTTSHSHELMKKRSSNTDRHRKIRTAHGLRDRRMRLSLQVAQPFFKLQDMLGCDRASKTIEWLLLQSKAAINELRESKHGSTPTTKCTATSSNSSDDGEVESTTTFGDNRKARRVSTSTTKGEPNKRTRKRTTKEERKVARERAKRRTLERMMHSRGNINNFFTTLSYYQQRFDVSQNVSNNSISAQQNSMGSTQ